MIVFRDLKFSLVFGQSQISCLNNDYYLQGLHLFEALSNSKCPRQPKNLFYFRLGPST